MRPAPLLLILTLGGCVAEPPGPLPDPPSPLSLPEPWALPVVDDPQDPFVSYRDGAEVQDWEARRGELHSLFSHYVYGPALPAPSGMQLATTEAAIPDGRLAVVEASWEEPPITLSIAVFTPPGDGPFPMFAALNKCGNHSLGPWPEVPVTASWVPSTCVEGEAGRGSRAEAWPVASILQAGWGLIALHQDTLVPDASLLAAQSPLLAADEERERGGAIGAWAWGLSRALDAAQDLPQVDPERVVTVGHSRRGKAALLAAARDRRFAAAIPHQSGTGGVTLSRSHGGESVASITSTFPHWFSPRFADFGDDERRLPLDQHLLVALVAPRPVFASDGDADDWADPSGARESIELAAPVWDWLGADGLVSDADGPTLHGRLAWGTRPGGHSLEAQDWTRFLAWVEQTELAP